jgi:hypothetical protein
MMEALRRVGDWALSLLVPKLQAAAACCDPAPWYQYRCLNGSFQRRQCHARCDCSTSCGPWKTIGPCPLV